MEDRARLYNAYLRQFCLPAGQVADLLYTAPDLQTLALYQDLGDSAPLQGTLPGSGGPGRYKAQARRMRWRNVAKLVQHDSQCLWNVAREPGLAARIAAPSNSYSLLLSSITVETSPANHPNGLYDGQEHVWMGGVSGSVNRSLARLLGGLPDGAHRRVAGAEFIRSDMVTFVEQLMLARKVCPRSTASPA